MYKRLILITISSSFLPVQLPGHANPGIKFIRHFQRKNLETSQLSSSFFFSAKGLAFVVLAICIAVDLSVVFVVVLTAGFSYYRKLWSPEVGLCFQVCTGTLALDGERLLSQHESGLRFSSTHSGLHFRVVLGQLGFLIGDWN